MNEADESHVQVTPEELVNDFLIGEFELEKLKNGFQAPVVEGAPCAEHRHLITEQQHLAAERSLEAK